MSSTPSTPSSPPGERKLSRFRQYAEQFKNKPASHLLSFGILHEITAVVPLPIVYFALAETGLKIPFPEQAMEEGNKFVGRVAKYYGWSLEGADGARVMLNMATSYAVVKVNNVSMAVFFECEGPASRATGAVCVDDPLDSDADRVAGGKLLEALSTMREVEGAG
ncbi:hypothetical protein BGZ67_007098 [Mortierella alpina]|nr:hypothetical protein BGZ67_007098 [Mortierella alpina]